MSNPLLQFDREFSRDCYALLKPYWQSADKWVGLFYLSICLSLTVVSVVATVAINTFSKNFYNALQAYNTEALPGLLLYFGFLVLISTLASGYAFYFNGRLNLHWRKFLIEKFLRSWQQTRHTINLQALDNPDQRISEDIMLFVDLTLEIFTLVFQSGLTLILFGALLWRLSGNIFFIPGYLFLSALLFAIIGSGITHVFCKKLATLEYEKQKWNADFRFALMALREKRSVNPDFSPILSPVFHNYFLMIFLETRLKLVTGGYNAIAFIIGLVIAIPQYLHRQLQLGGLMQISGAFSSVVLALSAFINSYSRFAEWRSVIHRLREFEKLITTEKEKVKQDVIEEPSV